MCGRYAIFTEEDNLEIRNIINELNERYKASSSKPEFKTGEIFPTDTVPAVCADSSGQKRLELFKWGFPGFSSNPAVIINARSETIAEKPTFRKLLTANRCLLPASAFYEWKKTDGRQKIKYAISPKEHSLFYMAGLYNTFTGKDGKLFNAFVIITAGANSQMSEIHERMPVIIEKGNEKLWLDNTESSPNALKSVLMPYEKPLILKGA